VGDSLNSKYGGNAGLSVPIVNVPGVTVVRLSFAHASGAALAGSLAATDGAALTGGWLATDGDADPPVDVVEQATAINAIAASAPRRFVMFMVRVLLQ
jgi:hypothetical protein